MHWEDSKMAVHCVTPARGQEECLPVASPGMLSTASAREKSDSRAIRDRRILDNIHLARIIAIRIYESLPIHLELEELIQVGILGLIDAAERFDESKNVTFAGYAKHRIRGAILDSLREMDWASRDQRRRCKQVESVTRKLSGILQRAPTDAEIAEEMGVELEKWRQIAGNLRQQGPVSAASRPPSQDDLPEPEFPASESEHPDAVCRRNQITGALQRAIHTLPLRYQTVVTMYYNDEMTMREIGGVLGVNESRISQIHKSALRKMAIVLEAQGISGTAF